MPRYRFRWELIPRRLTRELADQLRLSGEPIAALQAAYGLRPRDKFVRDSWPVLRDSWLARDGNWRRFVVDELRARGLGRMDAPVRTKAQQMEYLGSCRNADALRVIVLAAFHQLGDISNDVSQTAGPPLDMAVTPAKPNKVWREDEPLPSALDETLVRAWVDFAGRLARMLARLEEGQVVILELPSPYDRSEIEGAAPYVEFGVTEDGMVSGTIPGRDLMDERHHLSVEFEDRLRRTGWMPRTDDPAGTGALSMSASLADVMALAEGTVSAVRDSFGVPHPSFLTAFGFSTEPNVVSPTIELGVPGVSVPLRGDEPDVVAVPEGPDHLGQLVDEAMTSLFGHPPTRDSDGDIPIRSGSAMVFVRVLPDAPIVELFAPLLLDVVGNALTLERLAQINQRVRFVKFAWRTGTVFAEMQLHCLPFVGAHLRHAVALMSEVADRADDELRLELGGQLFFADDADRDVEQEDPLPPELLTLLHLDPHGTGEVDPELAASVCNGDRDLILQFIRRSEEQMLSWLRSAERAAEQGDEEEAAACHHEEAAWQATVDLLRAALRVVVGG